MRGRHEMKVKMMLMFLAVMLVVAACGKKEETPAAEGTKEGTQAAQEVTLKVATLIPPMTDVLDIVKPLLKEDGVNLEVVVLSDNVQPNTALANKEVDANFFQHVPYMTQYNEANNANLVAVQPI
ncbi:MetQ/NlpA family ABC transporter substrate-binding protein, partial [Bacillus velezensis]